LVTAGPGLGIGYGYLLKRSETDYWCLPDEDTAKKQPSLSSGFRVDPKHLQEQPDTGADRRLYLYEADVDASPTGQGTHSIVRVSFRGRA
jgi:hypothetical protein